jgi:NADH pyrophosphatase NudC (nudix superfamily)
VSWISTVFAAERVGGTPRPDGVEVLEVSYFDRSELPMLRCKPHARLFVETVYAGAAAAYFQPAEWRPPSL